MPKLRGKRSSSNQPGGKGRKSWDVRLKRQSSDKSNCREARKRESREAGQEDQEREKVPAEKRKGLLRSRLRKIQDHIIAYDRNAGYRMIHVTGGKNTLDSRKRR